VAVSCWAEAACHEGQVTKGGETPETNRRTDQEPGVAICALEMHAEELETRTQTFGA
jgi:hypothetical protein